MRLLVILILTCVARMACAQGDRSTFFFAEHSGKLSPENMARLDSLCLIISADPFLKEKVVFNVYGYASSSELKVAPSIDEDRARAVVQYMMTQCIPDSAMWHVIDVTNLRKASSHLSAVGITTGGRK
jgi:outer membrane protein OmpA-like peptidoglycan-associated protein